jgi:hypothetical protein
MSATPVPVSKTEFQGDVLDREFKIVRDANTGEYFFDYVDATPEVKKALDDIQYYRLKSTKLSDIEAAIKARTKKNSGTASPTNVEVNTRPKAADTGKPANTTAKPANTTAKPANNTAKPANTTAKPANTTAKSGPNSGNALASTPRNEVPSKTNFNTALTRYQELMGQVNTGNKPLNNVQQAELKSVTDLIDRYEKANPDIPTSNGTSPAPLTTAKSSLAGISGSNSLMPTPTTEDYNAAKTKVPVLEAKADRTADEEKELEKLKTIIAVRNSRDTVTGGKRRAKKTKKAKTSKRKTHKRKH